MVEKRSVSLCNFAILDAYNFDMEKSGTHRLWLAHGNARPTMYRMLPAPLSPFANELWAAGGRRYLTTLVEFPISQC